MLSKMNEVWIIRWKKNRNHRGRAEVIGKEAADKFVDEKKLEGFKVKMTKKGG